MSQIQNRAFSESLGRVAMLMTGDPIDRADADLAYVLHTYLELGGRPIDLCLPDEARSQPTLADAVAAILTRQGKPAFDDRGVETEDITIPGPAIASADDTDADSTQPSEIAARVYRPTNGLNLYTPLILYIHGGGWVIGDLDSADASSRALAKKTGAIVVSADYRQAPEHVFPAAHDDTYAVWLWLVANARALGGDPRRLAVAGEGAGANMALNICLRARAERKTMPAHQVLICPMAGKDLTQPSYIDNMRSHPLDTPTVQWFYRHALTELSVMDDPRINLVERTDLGGLPSTTLMVGELDPLRSEGEALADALKAQGVALDFTLYEGMSHQFFGLGQLVTKALFAQSKAASNLTRAFSRGRPAHLIPIGI